MLAILLAVLVSGISCAETESANVIMNCQPGSLDSVNLQILLLTASSNSICHSEARNAFGRTYKRANFYIEQFTGGYYEYRKQTVRIKNFHATQNILQTFGDLIQFIDVSFDGNETDVEIVKLINEKCTKSLTQLHLRNCYGTLLDGLQRVFLKVTKVSFSTVAHPEFNASASTLQLDALFPRLKNLNCEIASVNDWNFVGNNHKELRSLRVAFPELNETNQPDVDAFFENCSNLTSLVINNSSMRILKAASERLPNLKSLQIHAISNDNHDSDEIYFKNVSHLYMSLLQNSGKIAQKLAFDRVKTMELDLRFELTDQWTQFFEKLNHTLEFFYFKTDSITQRQLASIAKSQPNITLVNLSTLKKIPPDAIVDFIGRSKHLFSLGLTMMNDSYDIAERMVFEGNLQHEWSISADSTDFSRSNCDIYDSFLLIFVWNYAIY